MKKTVFITILIGLVFILGGCQSSLDDYREQLNSEGWSAPPTLQRGDIFFDRGFPESVYPNLKSAIQATYSSVNDEITVGTILQFNSSRAAQNFYDGLGEEAAEAGNVRIVGKFVFSVSGPDQEKFYNALGFD